MNKQIRKYIRYCKGGFTKSDVLSAINLEKPNRDFNLIWSRYKRGKVLGLKITYNQKTRTWNASN
jgi:hypothetical protein